MLHARWRRAFLFLLADFRNPHGLKKKDGFDLFNLVSYVTDFLIDLSHFSVTMSYHEHANHTITE